MGNLRPVSSQRGVKPNTHSQLWLGVIVDLYLLPAIRFNGVLLV
jgi:hypothetical protein